MTTLTNHIQLISDVVLGECSKWKHINSTTAGEVTIHHYEGLIKLLSGIYVHASLSQVGDRGMWVIDPG